ncbi:MAG: hypothetical protein Q9M28_04350 [Mariprofundaceae bacterium]|nr:hypothetical protein [Mariprofundaceae bacterium]
MRYFGLAFPLFLLTLFAGTSHVLAGQWDVGGQASLQTRYFPASPSYSTQKNVTISGSVTLEPEIVYDFDNGNDRIVFSPFARFDGDDKKRTHADIRELHWLHLGQSWDLSVGISKVYWGVTESVHLVDIINQTDVVEDVTGEAKLGQAMINANIEQDWGTLSLFALPAFLPRNFTANNARLHGPLPIDHNNPSYESKQENRHVDGAARFSIMIADLDLALSYFQGTSREARFFMQNQAGQLVLVPRYDQIAQTGLELQLTTENTLWKVEGITRTGHGPRFYAGVAGFEHTFYGIASSNADMGILVEYLYDNRDPRFAPASIANHDVFAGFRLALNDTQDTTMLFGGSWDHKSDAGFINFEAERRMTDHLKMSLNGRFFVNTPPTDPLYPIRNDDLIELNLNWFF